MLKEDVAITPRRFHNLKPAYQVVLARTVSRIVTDRSLHDKWRHKCHSYSRWVARYSRVVLKRIRMYEPPSTDDVTTQATVLCRDFVYQRLKRQNLLSIKLELHPSASRGSEVALEILSLTGELEKQYPHLYHNICRQINTVMSSELLVTNTFQNIADAMFNGHLVTWGRIIALFLIASSLSAECVQQGHPEFVRCIVDAFGDATRIYLAPWIVRQGGWNDIRQVFRASKESSTIWAVTGVGAVLGFVVTIITSLAL